MADTPSIPLPSQFVDDAAICVLQDSGGRVLTVSRWGGSEADIGFPGGHVDPGETPTTAVVRELYEETGVQIKATDVYRIFVAPSSDKPTRNVHVYCTWDAEAAKQVAFSAEQGTKVRWAEPEELLGALCTFAAWTRKHFKDLFGREPKLRATTANSQLDLGTGDVHTPGGGRMRKGPPTAPASTHEAGAGALGMSPGLAGATPMAVLKSKARNKLPGGSFAWPEKRKLPINDKTHAANARARLEGMRKEMSPAVYARVKSRIEAAERKFGIKAADKRKAGLSVRAHMPYGGELHVRHMDAEGQNPETDRRICAAFFPLDDVFVKAIPDEGPSWIQIATPGHYEGHRAGPFDLNELVFQSLIRNYRDVDMGNLPFDFNHAMEQPPTSGNIPTHGTPAQAWALDLKIVDGTLHALVDWLPLARGYAKNKQYKFVSPVIRWNDLHPRTGKPIGPRLSSVAFTNQPFLRDLQPMAASAQEGGAAAAGDTAAPRIASMSAYAYSSHEYMPKFRSALQLPALATAQECSDAMDRLCEAYEMADGGDVHGIPVGSYTAALRDAMAAPMASTVEEIFDAVKAMIKAAIEEHEATMHDADGGDGDDAEMTAAAGATTDTTTTTTAATGAPDTTTNTDGAAAMADTKELEAKNLELTSQLSAKEGKTNELTLQLNAAETAKTDLAAQNAKLAEQVAAHAAEKKAGRVDRALLDHGATQKLTDAHKPMMLSYLESNADGFEKLYPLVEPNTRHLTANLTGGGAEGQGNAGAGGARQQGAGELPVVELSAADIASGIAAAGGMELSEAQAAMMPLVHALDAR